MAVAGDRKSCWQLARVSLWRDSKGNERLAD